MANHLKSLQDESGHVGFMAAGYLLTISADGKRLAEEIEGRIKECQDLVLPYIEAKFRVLLLVCSITYANAAQNESLPVCPSQFKRLFDLCQSHSVNARRHLEYAQHLRSVAESKRPLGYYRLDFGPAIIHDVGNLVCCSRGHAYARRSFLECPECGTVEKRYRNSTTKGLQNRRMTTPSQHVNGNHGAKSLHSALHPQEDMGKSSMNLSIRSAVPEHSRFSPSKLPPHLRILQSDLRSSPHLNSVPAGKQSVLASDETSYLPPHLQ